MSLTDEDIMRLTARFILLFTIIWDITAGVKDVPVYTIEALIGETINLPCNVSTHEVGDDVILVLWYRENNKSPVYSWDIRDGVLNTPKRWSDEKIFGNRAYFLFDKQPGELTIQNAKDSDTAVYRCRVDLRIAQTRNSFVNVTVIIPPEHISIRDENDMDRVSIVGPYNVDDLITLKCEAFGGKPTPKLYWYRDGMPIIAETFYVPGGRSVKSEITIGPLTRQDLNSRLSCKAINHFRAPAMEAAVQIDMNFHPLNVRLLGAHQPLSAGRRYDLLCQSAGSRPPAVITWWRDEQRLERTTETTSSDGNQTTSTLSITLNRSDSGRKLTCRAYNNMLANADSIEDGWQLDIQYTPETKVRLGTSLDPETIREGTDVYFDCLVSAHPTVYKVEWRHNGRMLPHNTSQGIIVSNHSLVLQGVSRATAGNYSCVGFNAEGDGMSPPFHLNVLYAPSCITNVARLYAVANQEPAHIKCDVDANPSDVDFKWTFNNSAESLDVTSNHISRSGTSSIVTYTPMTELDYGTLLCTATNRIGRQRHPCVFHVIAAGRPDQVHNCTITNISMTSLGVRCTEGANGGLSQTFMLEVKDIGSQEIKANVTSPFPRFAVSNLHPGNSYLISIYAFNTRGRSDPTVLQTAMLRLPEKQLTSEKERPRSPLALTPTLSVVIGLAAALLIGGLAIILALRIPCGSKRKRKSLGQGGQLPGEGSPGPSDKSIGSKEIDGNESDEKNPDIIPDTIDSDDQIDYIRRRQHISTIDTNSPTRGLISTGGTPPSQTYVPMHGNGGHTSMGYCTLRNGGTQSSHSMSPVPNTYVNSMSSNCTLPRHQNHQHHQQWPTYGGAIAGVRHIPPIHYQSSGIMGGIPTNMVSSQHSPLSAQSSLPPLSSAAASALPSTIAMQHLNTRSRLCISVPEDEISADTPLMVKRESTV